MNLYRKYYDVLHMKFVCTLCEQRTINNRNKVYKVINQQKLDSLALAIFRTETNVVEKL